MAVYWRGDLEWTGSEPSLPDEVVAIDIDGSAHGPRIYNRYPWSAWASGVEYKFEGEQWGKTPRAMANFWRAWAKRKGKTCHAYVGCGTGGVEYVLLSMADLDPDHDSSECDRCGDEDKRYG